MRLIDADDLPISSIDMTDVGYYVSKYGQGISAVYLEDIEDAPTIELLTQPEIIRCKDCKNSEHWYRDKRRCFLWSEVGISVFNDGFCNYAERRQDGSNKD